MRPRDRQSEVRRIAVAMDSSDHAIAALDAAAALAEQLHAELEGFFVRDIALTRLAALPVGREIQFLTGRGRDFTGPTLDAQNRDQEVYARRAIAAAAARAQVKHTFRVVHGQVAVEVISAAGKADLLVLGIGSKHPWGRTGPTARTRLGNTARAAAERATRSVLLVKPGTRLIGAPLVCYDGSDGAKLGLEAAIGILGAGEKGLAVLLITDVPEEAAVLRREVEARLDPLHIRPRFLYSADSTPDQLCRAAAECGADALVIAGDSRFQSGSDWERILESASCPVLIVR